MAQFQGFTCDGCGEILSSDDRTKVKTKLEGPTVEGQYDLDLCADCTREQVPTDVELKPLRRRRSKKSHEQEAGERHREQRAQEEAAGQAENSPVA